MLHRRVKLVTYHRLTLPQYPLIKPPQPPPHRPLGTTLHQLLGDQHLGILDVSAITCLSGPGWHWHVFLHKHSMRHAHHLHRIRHTFIFLEVQIQWRLHKKITFFYSFEESHKFTLCKMAESKASGLKKVKEKVAVLFSRKREGFSSLTASQHVAHSLRASWDIWKCVTVSSTWEWKVLV